MSKILISILFVIVLFPAAARSADPGQGGHAFNLQQYRCEIIDNYIRLKKITDGYGDILLSENYEDIFRASIAVIGSLDGMEHELQTADVPPEMREAHDVFLKSVDSYRQGADFVRIAIGTYLGKYERKGTDIQEMIDQSIRRVTMANNYLEQSIALHGNLLEANNESPGVCKKVVARNY